VFAHGPGQNPTRRRKSSNYSDRLLELPPPKFLVPYLEAASLEEEGDAALQEKWARLLANAGAKPDSLCYFARTVLGELSAVEGVLLDQLVQKCQVLTYASFQDYIIDRQVKLTTIAKAMDATIKKLDAGELARDPAQREMVGSFEGMLGLQVVGWAINTKSNLFSKPDGYVSFNSREFADSYDQFLILEGRRLIDSVHFRPRDFFGSPVLSIEHVSFTKLGFGVARKLYKIQGPKRSERCHEPGEL